MKVQQLILATPGFRLRTFLWFQKNNNQDLQGFLKNIFLHLTQLDFRFFWTRESSCWTQDGFFLEYGEGNAWPVWIESLWVFPIFFKWIFGFWGFKGNFVFSFPGDWQKKNWAFCTGRLDRILFFFQSFDSLNWNSILILTQLLFWYSSRVTEKKILLMLRSNSGLGFEKKMWWKINLILATPKTRSVTWVFF